MSKDGASGHGIDRLQQTAGEQCTAAFGCVSHAEEFFRSEVSSGAYRGHQDTRSALLCYAVDSGANWITLHLRPDPLWKEWGLEPGDGFYFHISIAKIKPARAGGGR